MSRIRGKNTGPERALFSALRADGLRFSRHAKNLAGTPDVVFRARRVAVFVDGDFWHGWRYPAWSARLPPYWKAKIERNRRRDAKNFRRLRRAGWTVVRIWEHQVNSDLPRCIERVREALQLHS